jgi:hypothetical protein
MRGGKKKNSNRQKRRKGGGEKIGMEKTRKEWKEKKERREV